MRAEIDSQMQHASQHAGQHGPEPQGKNDRRACPNPATYRTFRPAGAQPVEQGGDARALVQMEAALSRVAGERERLEQDYNRWGGLWVAIAQARSFPDCLRLLPLTALGLGASGRQEPTHADQWVALAQRGCTAQESQLYCTLTEGCTAPVPHPYCAGCCGSWMKRVACKPP